MPTTQAKAHAPIKPGDVCDQMRANHVVRQVRVVTVNEDLQEALVTATQPGPLRGHRYFIPLADLLVR